MHTKPRKSIFKIPFFVFAILLIVACSVKYMSGFITVSSTVNGRELPIYSVETDEKKVALSFDAAWADCKLRKKSLEAAYYRFFDSIFIRYGNGN